MNLKIYSINYITLVLIILVFLPAVINFGTNGINLVEIIAFTTMPFVIFYKLFIQKKAPIVFLLITLFLIDISISFVYGATVLNRGFSDLFTMYAGMLKMLSFYFLGYIISNHYSYNTIQKHSKIFFYILAIFGVMQIFLYPVKLLVHNIYFSSIWDVLQYNAATVSFYHNVYYIFGIIIFGIMMQENRKFLRLDIASTFMLVLVLFFSIYASVLTIIIGFLLVYFIFLYGKVKYLYMFIFGTIFLFLIMNYKLSIELEIIKEYAINVYYGSNHLSDILFDLPALGARFEVTLVLGYEAFLSSPIIGIGPGGSMDSFYIDMLASYGVIGSFIFFMILYVVYRREHKINKKIAFLIILFLLFAVFQKSFFSGKTAEIFWLLIGILDQSYYFRVRNYIYNVRYSNA